MLINGNILSHSQLRRKMLNGIVTREVDKDRPARIGIIIEELLLALKSLKEATR
jgi:DNA-binding HxlR family transcriptional regulator